MKFRIACLMFALAASVALVGCDTTKAPGAGEPEMLSDARYPQVAALEGLTDYLSVDKPIVTAAEGNKPMTVVVPVRLRSDQQVNAQYRFMFLGENGAPIGTQPEWQFEKLPARTQVFLAGASLDPAAVDWRLEIRPAR